MQLQAHSSNALSGIASRDFQRILLVKTSSLGDIIHTLPVLNGLRRRYPAAQISWIVNREYADLLKSQPQIDDVIPFDRQQFKSFWRAIRATFRLGGLARQLRQGQYELVIDLQGLFRSGLMAWASQAPFRLGFDQPRERWARWFYNHCIPTPNTSQHAVEKNYQVAAMLGFDYVPIEFNLTLQQQDRDRATHHLTAHGLNVSEPYAVVLPGSRWETKNWWPERFSATIDQIQAQLGLRVVILGSSAEANLCQLIAQTCRSKPMNLVGQTDPLEFVALMDGASLVICNDSAGMHIAAALHKPLVAIFGPTHPGRTGPYGQKSKFSVLQAHLPCAPCYFRRLRQCPVHHECMNQITVEAVVHAASQLIKSSS